MADFSIIALLSFFGWLSVSRLNFIGAGIVIGLAFVMGVSHG